MLRHICGKWCVGEAGLAAHSHWVHAAQGPLARARACLVGSLCPTCGGEFRTRVRLLRHAAHGANACVAAVQAGLLPPLPAATVAAANAADKLSRAAGRKSGQRDHAGLAFLPAPLPPARRPTTRARRRSRR